MISIVEWIHYLESLFSSVFWLVINVLLNRLKKSNHLLRQRYHWIPHKHIVVVVCCVSCLCFVFSLIFYISFYHCRVRVILFQLVSELVCFPWGIEWGKGLEIGRREMVEVDKCLDGLLKALWFVETSRERKSLGNQEMERLLMEFSTEKESLLTMVVQQRLMIESLLLSWKTRGSY